MGDWTSGRAIIHSCPPHQVRAVVSVLENYSMTSEDDPEARKVINLGDTYANAGNFAVGNAEDVAHDLIAEAPDASFTVAEEPAYEYLGTTCLYVPHLGLYTADCNQYGNPMFTLEAVLALDDKPAEIRQRKLGVSWMTAIEAMQPAGAVVEPDSYVTHWNRRDGEVTVVDGKVCGDDLLFATPPGGAAGSSPAAVVYDADPDTAPEASVVDAALTEHGFLRATEWVPLDETSRIWRTDVYRHPTS